jgi:ATP/maltotriose-dependent transcriptional regulator MalT
MLKYVRRRARLTQRDLAIAVGYSEAHLCRLEQNQRLPDPTTLLALFVPALQLEDEPALATHLLELAAAARDERAPGRGGSPSSPHAPAYDSGALELIPTVPPYVVARPALLARLAEQLGVERIVALCGLGGMGKTTLAAALARQEQAARPVFWLTLTAGVTTTAEALLRQLALFLQAQGHTQLQPLLQPGVALAPDQQLALIGAALASQPALLCFDNVHLVQHDPVIARMLQHLVAATPASLLLTSREAVPLAGAAQVRLTGLAQPEGLALIERLWPSDRPALAAPLAARLLHKTGGSPMLLRLAIGHLRDQAGDPAVFIERLATEPQVASYLLDGVLGQLARPALRLAELIAVFRQPIDLYDEALLTLLHAADGPYDLAAALAELQRRQLIDHPARATLHALVRDHLYAALTLDMARRQRLHSVAAEWSEQAGHVVEAAYHACQAGNLQQAVDVLNDQGETLLNRGQAQAAAEVVDALLARLRRQAHPDELRRQLLTVRGDLLVHTLRTAEAESDYRQALALAEQQASPRVRAQLAWRLAYGLMQRGQAAEAVTLCRSAAASITAGDTLLLAQLAAAECRGLMISARYEEAVQVARRALTLADQVAGLMPRRADEVRARAHNTLGIILEFWRQYATALDHLQRAVAAAQRAEMRQFEQRCIMNVGGFLLEQGDLLGALDRYSTALSGARALGDSYTAELILHNLGVIHYLRAEFDAALARLDEACAIDEQMGNQSGRADSQQQRARVLLALGRTDEARAVIDEALLVLADSTDQRARGYALDVLSMIQMVQGDSAGAQTTLLAALALPVTAEDGQLRSYVRQRLAVALLISGDSEAARQTIADEPPAGAGPEVLLDYQIFGGICALAEGDPAAAVAAARAVADRAAASGYRLYERPAARLLAAVYKAPPLAALPPLLWGAPEQAAPHPHQARSGVPRDRPRSQPSERLQRRRHVA